MFKWLEEKSKDKQISNITKDLDQLIESANKADQFIKNNGCTNQAVISSVSKAQKDLLFSLLGPLEIDEIEKDIFDSLLKDREDISPGAKMAIDHVIKSFKENQN